MKSLGLRKGVWLVALAIMFLVGLPATGLGQGRGRWGNRGNQSWKCGKFVNCHDARDGRWDRDRRRNIFRNDNYRERNRQWQRYYNRNNRQRLQYPYNYDQYNYALKNRYRNRDGNRRYVVRYRRW
jgi:hypothetical protein